MPGTQATDDWSPPSRELTVEEALALGIVLQQNEQLAEAAELYRRVLDTSPDHPQALHYAGVLAHQQGRSDDGLVLIERSLGLADARADWYSNFGIVLQSLGRLDEALEAYRRAIAIDAAHANAYSNLGVVLKALGKPSEAEAAYRTAIRLNPGHADAYVNLGILLNGAGRTHEAAACYCKAVTLRPQHPDSRKLLVLAHCTLGQIGEAVAILDEWRQAEPHNPIARHMHAACTGRDVPARASNEFVESTFDSFAASFESKLQKLSYRAPALVAATISDAGLQPLKQLDVLDAGCGTGLCGPLVAPHARRLVGVDLSAGMLARAKEKNVYDELLRGEVTEYLRANTDRFDLIVSADSLVYFGDLEEVLRAASAALRPGGLVIFTLEHAARETSEGYRLEFHGRYSHDRAYVERLLTASGLEPRIVHAELRMEAGVPVPGLVVRGMKLSAASACRIMSRSTSVNAEGSEASRAGTFARLGRATWRATRPPRP